MNKPKYSFLGQGWRFWALIIFVFLAAQWVMLPRMTEFRKTVWVIFPCIMAIICLGLNLIYGFNGQFSLGQWGFYAIGAYASAIITYRYADKWSYPVAGWVINVPPVLQRLVPVAQVELFKFDAGKAGIFLAALALGVALAGLVSLVFGYVVLLRLGSDYFGIATLGFTVIVQVLLINSDLVLPETKGARGMIGIPSMTSFFWAFVFLVLVLVITRNLLHSTVGRAIMSVREDEIAAQAMGIDALRYKLTSFVMGSLFAGLAGGLYAHLYAFISPQYFDFTKSFDPMIIIVFGGLGNLTGTIIATFLWALTVEGLRIWLPQGFEAWRFVVYPIALVLLMLFRPQGLMGRIELGFLRPAKWPKRARTLGARPPPVAAVVTAGSGQEAQG